MLLLGDNLGHGVAPAAELIFSDSLPRGQISNEVTSSVLKDGPPVQAQQKGDIVP